MDHWFLVFCPLALIPKGEFDEGFNWGRRVRVKVGEQFSLGKVKSQLREGESMVDNMMLRLAALLPENMRGVYNR